MEHNEKQYSIDIISAMAERTIKRLWVIIIILLALLAGTNAAWIWYESQFEEIVMTQEATTDGGGDAIANGVASGDIYYGESKTNDQSQETQDGR